MTCQTKFCRDVAEYRKREALYLSEWIEEVRKRLESLGLQDIGERQIGQLLANSPAGGDGIWPHEAIRDVFEELPQTQKVESGLEIGKLNLRGVVSRDPFEGEEQERELARQYREHAEQIQLEWLRTAVLLQRLANHYQRQALNEDEEAALLDRKLVFPQ